MLKEKRAGKKTFVIVYMYKLSAHDASKVVRLAALIGIATATFFLVVMSTLVRHTVFMKENPGGFIVEVLAVSVFAGLPLFMVAYTRKSSYWRAFADFFILSAKLALFWILFELSGTNAMLFPMKKKYEHATRYN